MSALQFTLTTAGQSLLSQVSTIGPVTLTKVAIGSGALTPSGSVTALQTQIKQLTPTGSSVPGPGIIHITAQDNSTDSYSVKEIGLYAGTTLFAYYSQSTAILSKASGNVSLFSIDIALQNVASSSVTIGSATFAYPPATESTQGVAQIATTAQVAAGTDNTTIVTPAKLAGAAFVKKAGDTMTGQLTLPNATAQKGSATIVVDPNMASSGNAYLQAAGAGAFYIGTGDAHGAGIFSNSLVRLFVNADGTINAQGNIIYNSPSVVPAGMVAPFAMTAIPTGWLPCNGAAISRTIYANLFAAIGTTFGVGDGSTTFNLPEGRGEFLRGWDAGRGVDSGRAFGSWQADALASHVHGYTLPDSNGSGSGDAYASTYGENNPPYYRTTAAAGGSETRPRNLALYFAIKY